MHPVIHEQLNIQTYRISFDKMDYNFSFKDMLNTDVVANQHVVYVDFSATYITETYQKADLLADETRLKDMVEQKVQALSTNQVAIMFPTASEIMQVISKNCALCLSFGTNYDSFIDEYSDSCEIRTFVSDGKEYLFMMKKNLLNTVVNHIRYIYKMRMGHPLEKLYLRASISIGFEFTNVPPAQFLERYLEIDMDTIPKQDNLLCMRSKLLTHLSQQQEDELNDSVKEFNQTHADSGISAHMVIENQK